jgi:hypothetical protein
MRTRMNLVICITLLYERVENAFVPRRQEETKSSRSDRCPPRPHPGRVPVRDGGARSRNNGGLTASCRFANGGVRTTVAVREQHEREFNVARGRAISA